LTYFLEDDTELQHIHDVYESGEMLTGELKKIAIKEIGAYVSKFQQRRAKISDEELNMFMDGHRSLRLGCHYNWTNQVRTLPSEIMTDMQKTFVPADARYPAFPDELVINIMTYIPLKRAKVLLYKNGDMDPCLCELEVELYQKHTQRSAIYIGFFKDDQPVIEEFSDANEMEKRLEALKESKDGDHSLDYVIVGLEKAS
jgi:hypothetical protein